MAEEKRMAEKHMVQRSGVRNGTSRLEMENLKLMNDQNPVQWRRVANELYAKKPLFALTFCGIRLI